MVGTKVKVQTVRIVIEGEEKDKGVALIGLLKSSMKNPGVLGKTLDLLDDQEIMHIARCVHGQMYRRLGTN